MMKQRYIAPRLVFGWNTEIIGMFSDLLRISAKHERNILKTNNLNDFLRPF